MSVIVRHPITREIVLYCKGADSTIMNQLARTGRQCALQKSKSELLRCPSWACLYATCLGSANHHSVSSHSTEDSSAHHTISRTQHHLHSYASQGLRVLVVARRSLTESQYLEWVREKADVEHLHDHKEREKRTRELFFKMESSLTLLGECFRRIILPPDFI